MFLSGSRLSDREAKGKPPPGVRGSPAPRGLGGGCGQRSRREPRLGERPREEHRGTRYSSCGGCEAAGLAALTPRPLPARRSAGVTVRAGTGRDRRAGNPLRAEPGHGSSSCPPQGALGAEAAPARPFPAPPAPPSHRRPSHAAATAPSRRGSRGRGGAVTWRMTAAAVRRRPPPSQDGVAAAVGAGAVPGARREGDAGTAVAAVLLPVLQRAPLPGVRLARGNGGPAAPRRQLGWDGAGRCPICAHGLGGSPAAH